MIFFFFLPSNFNIQWPVEKQRKQVDDLIQCLEVLLFQNWAAFKGIMRQVSIGKCVCKVSVLFGLMGESPGHDIRPSVGSWFWDLDSWPGSSFLLASCWSLLRLSPQSESITYRERKIIFQSLIDSSGETCILSPPVWMCEPCFSMAFSLTCFSGIRSTPLLILLLQIF